MAARVRTCLCPAGSCKEGRAAMTIKDLLSVKEFSQFTGIEQTTLRYWDDIGLFSPDVRDPNNNYRYYSPQQIIAVNFVAVLSELNIPLKTIGDMEQERTPEKIVQLIEQREKELDQEMRQLREKYSIIHTRREMINYGMKVLQGFNVVEGKRILGESPVEGADWVDLNKISVLWREEAPYILGPRNDFTEDGEFYNPFMNFCNHAAELRINLSFPIGALHDSVDSFMAMPGSPDYFFSWDPAGNRYRAAGDYLIGFSRGYYGQLGDLPERMLAYAKDHDLKLTGPVYTNYLLDEICLTDPSQYLAQLSVKVEQH